GDLAARASVPGRAFFRVHRVRRDAVSGGVVSFRAAFYAQFRKPAGLLGAVVGHVMALKNARRGAWVIGLVRPRPGERILQVGFGPGADARKVLAAVGSSGSFAGADFSEVMVRQAVSRNRGAVGQGRADFRLADIAAGLPWNDEDFDAVYSINC